MVSALDVVDLVSSLVEQVWNARCVRVSAANAALKRKEPNAAEHSDRSDDWSQHVHEICDQHRAMLEDFAGQQFGDEYTAACHELMKVEPLSLNRFGVSDATSHHEMLREVVVRILGALDGPKPGEGLRRIWEASSNTDTPIPRGMDRFLPVEARYVKRGLPPPERIPQHKRRICEWMVAAEKWSDPYRYGPGLRRLEPLLKREAALVRQASGVQSPEGQLLVAPNPVCPQCDRIRTDSELSEGRVACPECLAANKIQWEAGPQLSWMSFVMRKRSEAEAAKNKVDIKHFKDIEAKFADTLLKVKLQLRRLGRLELREEVTADFIDRTLPEVVCELLMERGETSSIKAVREMLLHDVLAILESVQTSESSRPDIKHRAADVASSDAAATGKPDTSKDAEPASNGYVPKPVDPTAYVSQASILAEHIPLRLPISEKQLPGILEDYSR